MKTTCVLVLACMVVAVTISGAEGKELALETLKIEGRNCLVKFREGILSVVHVYDNEKREQRKRLQALGYIQGSDDYAAQLVIPYTFPDPEISVRITVSSLIKSAEGPHYVVIALTDDSGRTLAAEGGGTQIKDAGPLSARLKTLGRKKGAIVLKFPGLKHVNISKIEVE